MFPNKKGKSDMKQKTPGAAGLSSVIFAVAIVVALYTLLGTVDLAFLQDGRQVNRMNDVSLISEITLPDAQLSYVADGETKSLESVDDLKAHIGPTLINNFINLKWEDVDHIIIITQE